MRIRGLLVARYAAAPVATRPARTAAPSSVEPVEGGPVEGVPGGDSDGDWDDGVTPVITIDFCRYNTWYEIDSWWEGNFVERVAAGAFTRTLAGAGASAKCLFDHGMDYYIGDKPLGVPESIVDTSNGPHAEVPMLDTMYCREILPGLAAGAYGSSFMFEVLADSWVYEPKVSTANPEALPERTITEVKLYEMGPVTWPANPDATAGLRSLADRLMTADGGRRAAQRATLAPLYDEFRSAHKLRRRTSRSEPVHSDVDTSSAGPVAPLIDVPDAAAVGTDAAGEPHNDLSIARARRMARERVLTLSL